MSIVFWGSALFFAFIAKVILVPVIKYQVCRFPNFSYNKLTAHKYAALPRHNKEKGPYFMALSLAIPDGGKLLIEGLKDKNVM